MYDNQDLQPEKRSGRWDGQFVKPWSEVTPDFVRSVPAEPAEEEPVSVRVFTMDDMEPSSNEVHSISLGNTFSFLKLTASVAEDSENQGQEYWNLALNNPFIYAGPSHDVAVRTLLGLRDIVNRALEWVDPDGEILKNLENLAENAAPAPARSDPNRLVPPDCLAPLKRPVSHPPNGGPASQIETESQNETAV